MSTFGMMIGYGWVYCRWLFQVCLEWLLIRDPLLMSPLMVNLSCPQNFIKQSLMKTTDSKSSRWSTLLTKLIRLNSTMWPTRQTSIRIIANHPNLRTIVVRSASQPLIATNHLNPPDNKGLNTQQRTWPHLFYKRRKKKRNRSNSKLEITSFSPTQDSNSNSH